MTKRMIPVESRNVSFVKISNANLVELTLKQLIQHYTKYANKILEVNVLREEKAEKLKELRKKLGELDVKYERLLAAMPKKAEERHQMIPQQKPKVIPIRDVEMVNVSESFEGLRDEFERIREELERIR